MRGSVYRAEKGSGFKIGANHFGFCCRKDLRDGFQGLVAIKVISIDETDYKVNPRAKDESLKDLELEVKVLRQLEGTKAENVNMILDVVPIHSQIWIVSEYCTGGSVHTLVSLAAMLCYVLPFFASTSSLVFLSKAPYSSRLRILLHQFSVFLAVQQCSLLFLSYALSRCAQRSGR